MNSLELNTDGGLIKATMNVDPDYPCIQMEMDGLLIGVFEYDSLNKMLRYRIYSEDPDVEEPIINTKLISQ